MNGDLPAPPTAIGGRVLDVTAIHDIVHGRTLYAAAFLAAAHDVGIVLAVPAVALQEAWAIIGVDDQPFLELLLALPLTMVEPLEAESARQAGILGRAALAAGQWDPAAAHAVLVSGDRGWPVLTSAPETSRRLDAHVAVDILPDR